MNFIKKKEIGYCDPACVLSREKSCEGYKELHGKECPYLLCPVLRSEKFLLRLVAEEDAQDLLSCYSDRKAQVIFNADTCTSDFRYDILSDMKRCIRVWLESYENADYIRFSILDIHTKKAVGTIEMFGFIGNYKVTRGILRLDICSQYENAPALTELLTLCKNEFFGLFQVKEIVTKASPLASERISVLKTLGFTKYNFPEREFYWGIYK